MPNGIFPVEMTDDDYLEEFGPARDQDGFREGTVANRAALFGGGQLRPTSPANVGSTKKEQPTPVEPPATRDSVILENTTQEESGTDTGVTLAEPSRDVVIDDVYVLDNATVDDVDCDMSTYTPSDPYAYPGALSARRIDCVNEEWNKPEQGESLQAEYQDTDIWSRLPSTCVYCGPNH